MKMSVEADSTRAFEAIYRTGTRQMVINLFNPTSPEHYDFDIRAVVRIRVKNPHFEIFPRQRGDCQVNARL